MEWLNEEQVKNFNFYPILHANIPDLARLLFVQSLRFNADKRHESLPLSRRVLERVLFPLSILQFLRRKHILRNLDKILKEFLLQFEFLRHFDIGGIPWRPTSVSRMKAPPVRPAPRAYSKLLHRHRQGRHGGAVICSVIQTIRTSIPSLRQTTVFLR